MALSLSLSLAHSRPLSVRLPPRVRFCPRTTLTPPAPLRKILLAFAAAMGIQTAVDTGLLAADLNSRFDGMIPENVPLLVAFGGSVFAFRAILK